MVSIFKKNDLIINENYLNEIIKFVKFTNKLLKINDNFSIYLLSKGDDKNSTTGGFNRNSKSIYVLYENRALIDILRSIAHEIEHQRQNNLNLIGNNPQNIGGFLENDANIIAGILIKLYVKFIDNRNIYWM